MIGYEPAGGQELIYGITRTTIAQVPTWFYILSMMFGILSGFGCMLYAPEMIIGRMRRIMGVGVYVSGILFCGFR